MPGEASFAANRAASRKIRFWLDGDQFKTTLVSRGRIGYIGDERFLHVECRDPG